MPEEVKNQETEEERAARLNAVIRRSVRQLAPPQENTVTQWAERKRVLSASAESGQWRTSRTPYLREIMDAYTDPNLQLIAVMACSQLGKTETILNIIGYVIEDDPSPILFVMPDLDTAKRFSVERVSPMLRDCKSLRRILESRSVRTEGNSLLQKTFPGGFLAMVGSHVADDLASRPVRRVIGDEIDRFASSAGKEGSPWDLATKRMITYYNKMAYACSTPTVRGHSKIYDLYCNGTMELWKHECPNCGGWHEITFNDIRFDHKKTETSEGNSFEIWNIRYLCPDCGEAFSEQQMREANAKWIATNPDAYRSGCRSFWIRGWASPWLRWESIIDEYLRAGKDPKKLQVVYNTLFGELWEDRGDLQSEEALLERRETYDAELPDGVLVLTCGVDTQDDRLEYEVVGHGMWGETWGIRKGIILGRPDSDDTWRKLDEEVLDRRFSFKDGVTLRISVTFQDEGGHFAQDVRKNCRRREAKHIYPCKGQGGDGVPYTAPPKRQAIVHQKAIIDYCWRYQLGVDAGKQVVMDNLSVMEPGPNYCHFPDRDDYGPAYFKGLLSERKVYKEGHKNPWQWEIIPGHERNEPLDCRNYAMAAFKTLNANMDTVRQRIAQLRANGGKEPPKQARSAPKRQSSRNLQDDW